MVNRATKRASELSKEKLVEMIEKLREVLYRARDERLDQLEIDELLEATVFDNDLNLSDEERASERNRRRGECRCLIWASRMGTWPSDGHHPNCTEREKP